MVRTLLARSAFSLDIFTPARAFWKSSGVLGASSVLLIMASSSDLIMFSTFCCPMVWMSTLNFSAGFLKVSVSKSMVSLSTLWWHRK